MSRDEIITEMLRRNGQATFVESPVARRYMGKVYDFVSTLPSEACSHAPPPRPGRDGEVLRCTCGKFAYRWGWKGPMEGRGWRLLP